MPVGTLPAEAKKVFESVYREARSSGDSEAVAKAWGAVKRTWTKKDGKWHKKSAAIAEMSMYITKASLANGVMKWQAVNSDTAPDSYAERMSLELYEDFIANIKNGSIPEVFRGAACSDYWCGGMPYVSVSHYPDLNGQAVPGEVLELFIDGDKLKARGILSDSPLGHAVYRSLVEDKVKPSEEKIRISIGFLDLGHRHGDGKLWVRDSLYSLCPECLEGVGSKVYMKGHLVHLALTRVPVNKRTEMVLEEKSEMATKAKKKTRKEDAESIIGKDLAEEIDAKNRVSAQKSDVLVEMSEGEEPTEEETQELVTEIEKSEAPESVEEPAEESAEEPVVEPVAEPVAEAAVEPAVEPVAEKAVVEKFEDATMDKVVNEAPAYVDNMPYGGAITMADAEKYLEAKNEAIYVMDMWSVFSSVAWNILERSDIPDKRAAMVNAIDGFKNLLTAKAMVAFGEVEDRHELQPALDVLLSAIDNSLSVEGDVSNKLQYVQPTLQELGTAITDYVSHKSVAQNEPPAPNNNNLLDEIKTLIQPLSEGIQSMSERVSVLEGKSNAQAVQPRNRIPQPRTLPANLVQKAEPPIKPGSIKDIVRKSVGITD